MAPETDCSIIVENLSVRMNKLFTLGPMSFMIPKKSVVGILGANGSGKTILLSTIVGLIRPTTGFVKLQNSINYGFSLQTPSFYPNKTVLQNLTIFSKYHGSLRIDIEQLLAELDISNYKNKKFKQLSSGIQKRMEFISALAGNPELVIFDEPSANVDEIGIKLIRNKLFQLIESGKTILITNHHSFELEEICTHYLILKHGMVIDFLDKHNFMSKYNSVKNAISETSE
jgi:ABC-2 type transport system ATP-binding protein